MLCKEFIFAIAGFFLLLPSYGAAENKKNKNQVISIEIGKLSPVEVGVMTPSGKFIFLRGDGINCQGVSVVSGKVLIVPAKSAGIYWDSDGLQHLNATFAELGVFTVYVSDNLETEFNNSSSIKKKYVNNGNYKVDISAASCGGGRVD